MERTSAGIAADVPPFDKIRASIGLPANSIWINRAERRVYVEPVRAPGWKLADYALTEVSANKISNQWNVRVLPQPQATLRVNLGDPEKAREDAINPEVAGWALLRWGINSVMMEAPDSDIVKAFIKGLADKGITARRVDPKEAPVRNRSASDTDDKQPEAVIQVYSISPTKAAEEVRKKAEAEAARKKAEAEKPEAANKPD
jgi:hypothetical protein